MPYIPTINTDGIGQAIGSFAQVIYQQQRDADQTKLVNSQIKAKQIDNKINMEMQNLPPEQWVDFYQKRWNEEAPGLAEEFNFKDNADKFSIGMRETMASAIPSIFNNAQIKLGENSAAQQLVDLQSADNIGDTISFGKAYLNDQNYIRNAGGIAQAMLKTDALIANKIGSLYADKASKDPISGYKQAEGEYQGFVNAYMEDGKFRDGITNEQKAEFNTIKNAVSTVREQAWNQYSQANRSNLITQLDEFKQLNYKTTDGIKNLRDGLALRFEELNSGGLNPVMNEKDQEIYGNALKATWAGTDDLLKDANLRQFWLDTSTARNEQELYQIGQRYKTLVPDDKIETVLKYTNEKNNVGRSDGISQISSSVEDQFRKMMPQRMGANQLKVWNTLAGHISATVTDRLVFMSRDKSFNSNDLQQEADRILNGYLSVAENKSGNSQLNQFVESLYSGKSQTFNLSDMFGGPEEELLKSVVDNSTYYNPSDSSDPTYTYESAAVVTGASSVQKLYNLMYGITGMSAKVTEFGKSPDGDNRRLVYQVTASVQQKKQGVPDYVGIVYDDKNGLSFQEYDSKMKKGKLIPFKEVKGLNGQRMELNVTTPGSK